MAARARKEPAKKAAPAKKARVRKTTAKSTGLPVGALIPQPHGGALRNGGTNAGGTGRPPNWWRERAAEHLETARADGGTVFDFARDVVSGKVTDADTKAKLDAWKALTGVVVPKQKDVTVEDVRGRLAATLDTIRAVLPAADADRLIAALRPVWL